MQFVLPTLASYEEEAYEELMWQAMDAGAVTARSSPNSEQHRKQKKEQKMEKLVIHHL